MTEFRIFFSRLFDEEHRLLERHKERQDKTRVTDGDDQVGKTKRSFLSSFSVF